MVTEAQTLPAARHWCCWLLSISQYFHFQSQPSVTTTRVLSLSVSVLFTHDLWTLQLSFYMYWGVEAAALRGGLVAHLWEHVPLLQRLRHCYSRPGINSDQWPSSQLSLPSILICHNQNKGSKCIKNERNAAPSTMAVISAATVKSVYCCSCSINRSTKKSPALNWKSLLHFHERARLCYGS